MKYIIIINDGTDDVTALDAEDKDSAIKHIKAIFGPYDSKQEEEEEIDQHYYIDVGSEVLQIAISEIAICNRSEDCNDFETALLEEFIYGHYINDDDENYFGLKGLELIFNK